MAVTTAGTVRGKEGAYLVSLPKLAWQLRFAQPAVMGRFDRAALWPIYELIAKKCGTFSKILTVGLKENGAPSPVRINSDATGGRGLASTSFLSFLKKAASNPLAFASQ